MPGGFSWTCPICGVAVSGRSIPGRGMSRANHLRSHGIWTSWLTPEEKEDNHFLLALYDNLKSGLDYYDAVEQTRQGI